MSWVKMDDQIFTHPKFIDLCKDAKLLFLAALTYCAAHLTDGIITRGALRVIAAMVDVSPSEAGTLVAVGLWEKHGADWVVHDYLEYQPTRDKALATKQARAEAGSRGGQRSADSRAEANQQAKPVQRVKPTPTPSPSPSESPSQDPVLRKEPGEAPPPAAEGSAGNAVKTFIDLFTDKVGERPDVPPRFMKALKELLARVGQETYRAALLGFLSDSFASENGYSVSLFVNQPTDRWVRSKPVAARSGPGATRTRAAAVNETINYDLSPDQALNSGWAAQIASDRAKEAERSAAKADGLGLPTEGGTL